jgi:hypothetical protein
MTDGNKTQNIHRQIPRRIATKRGLIGNVWSQFFKLFFVDEIQKFAVQKK